MSDFIMLMFALDTNSYTLVLLICGWGFMIMKSMLQMAGVAVASLPLLVFGALASNALLSGTTFVSGLQRGPGLALTTGIGMIAALAVIVVLMRISLFIKDSFGRRPELLDRV